MEAKPRDGGWIEVICGPMFSGKTEELIRRLRRASYAQLGVAVFKPALDDRFAKDAVVSHSDQRYAAFPVSSASEILALLDDSVEVVGIDEAQFFDASVVSVAERLAADGRRVVLAGLDTDYRGAPFDPMPDLMARAEYVTKLLAICVRCGNPANRSARLLPGDARVAVGASESYEPVCRRCHGAECDTAASASSQPASREDKR